MEEAKHEKRALFLADPVIINRMKLNVTKEVCVKNTLTRVYFIQGSYFSTDVASGQIVTLVTATVDDALNISFG